MDLNPAVSMFLCLSAVMVLCLLPFAQNSACLGSERHLEVLQSPVCHALGKWFSKYGRWTGNIISIIWEIVRVANSQALPWTS